MINIFSHFKILFRNEDSETIGKQCNGQILEYFSYQVDGVRILKRGILLEREKNFILCCLINLKSPN